jgi:ribosomal protein S18 acetylase RimI-like enzyme
MADTTTATSPIHPLDLGAIAAMHAEAFPASALTLLGPRVVTEYYRWQLDAPHDLVALAAREDGDLVGFVWAGTFRRALKGFVARNGLVLVTALARRPHLLLDARVRRRVRPAARILGRHFRRRLLHPGAVRADDVDAGVGELVTSPGRSFGILVLAVSPAARGTGVADLLIDEAEARARQAGLTQMQLTVQPGNARAVRFYERNGWSRHGDRPGPWSGCMTKALGP